MYNPTQVTCKCLPPYNINESYYPNSCACDPPRVYSTKLQKCTCTTPYYYNYTARDCLYDCSTIKNANLNNSADGSCTCEANFYYNDEQKSCVFRTNTAIIVGGSVAGGVVFFAIAIALYYFIWKPSVPVTENNIDQGPNINQYNNFALSNPSLVLNDQQVV